MIVECHSQRDDQEEGKEAYCVHRIPIDLRQRMLVHLTHLLLHSHLHVKAQTLCEIGQGLAKDHFHVGVGTARGYAHGPVDGGESRYSVSWLEGNRNESVSQQF